MKFILGDKSSSISFKSLELSANIELIKKSSPPIFIDTEIEFNLPQFNGILRSCISLADLRHLRICISKILENPNKVQSYQFENVDMNLSFFISVNQTDQIDISGTFHNSNKSVIIEFHLNSDINNFENLNIELIGIIEEFNIMLI